MDIIVPKLGLTIEEVEVVRWVKSVGDPVSSGDSLVELNADKSDVDVESPIDGVLSIQHVQEGEVLRVGAVIATIATAEEWSAGQHDRFPPARSDSDVVDHRSQDRNGPVRTSNEDLGKFKTPVSGGSPAARRLGTELGIDLSKLQGSGPGGRIVEADVQRAAQAAVSNPIVRPPLGLRPLVVSPTQRRTAERIARAAAETAPVTLHRRGDVVALRAAVNDARKVGILMTMTHGLVWAVSRALLDHPHLNALFLDGVLHMADQINIGIAVDRSGDLVVPVVRDVGAMSLENLVGAANTVVEAARGGSNELDVFTDGTFTVSNLGMFGVDHFTPILNFPQIAILGVGAVDSFDTVAMSLTFDHRAVNGAPAAVFLDAVTTYLRSIEWRSTHTEHQNE